ncbi:AfsR/SARP family transcriptional regulator [Streptomyces aidingensis]|uniref:DNA-binding transcriptional activator of the SARP family n=1 Tax=Streptomyces aidingensis TaxID=910347 RepID=A0A1I1R4J9_9ACTN|nr:AfsR/SARP family transcriptional regulator [Streptomyces aidingensis]SFD27068.1 DNA-binding transcriptional activator of the SARP family [Streptomyces aidingensis]
MQIKLLGHLSARLNHRSVVPSAAKQRQILALLALTPGQVVTVARLFEELWGDNPPRSAPTTLQTYILQLRGKLTKALTEEDKQDGRTAKDILVTRHGGYSLAIEPECVDVHEFRQLARAGRTAFDAGDDRAASAYFGRALELWHGEALMDLPLGRVLELEANSLEQTRLGLLGRRIEADLRLGRHTELLGELLTLVARNPMHESLSAQLMTALYRSGHTARALETFQQLRSTLISALGVEPAPWVRRLHQAILVGDPALDPPVARRGAAAQDGGMASAGAGAPSPARSARELAGYAAV